MEPIKTRMFDGIYGAPKSLNADIGGLPYFREVNQYYETTEIYSVWEPTQDERVRIALGENILISQLGEPIRPMSVYLTTLQRVEENAETKEE